MKQARKAAKPMYRVFARAGTEAGRERTLRWYGDFRRFADVGGGREALVPAGETLATADEDAAHALAEARYQALRRERAQRADREKLGLPSPVGLHNFAAEHLVKKARAGRVSSSWLTMSELHLDRAIAYFGRDRELGKISVGDVEGWVAELRRSGLSDGTARQHLNTLSNLYRRAIGERRVPPGFNPVSGLMEKPSAAQTREAKWLEVSDAALFLEAARLYVPKRADLAFPAAHAFVATAFLTGGRPAEVRGLEVGDINLRRETVTFRPTEARRLKTPGSHRTVPLWPQLREILAAYLKGPNAPTGRLLFPSPRTGKALKDARKLLDAIGAPIGIKRREMNMYVARHTYTAARLQTLDRGQPVAKYTVAQELGHGGTRLVDRVYGHLGRVRHRAAVVEYRVGQHAKTLGRRLTDLRAKASA